MKRSLPYRPKESIENTKKKIEVVDEWAAVLKHQAEVEKQLKEDEKMILKERQKRYREQLEKQRAEFHTQRAAKNQEKLKPESGFILKDAEERFKEIEERKKANCLEIAQEIKEKAEWSKNQRDRDKEERVLHENFMKILKNAEDRKRDEAIKKKQEAAHLLRNSYAEQQSYKILRKEEDRKRDKVLINYESSVSRNSDKEKMKVKKKYILYLRWRIIWRRRDRKKWRERKFLRNLCRRKSRKTLRKLWSGERKEWLTFLRKKWNLN